MNEDDNRTSLLKEAPSQVIIAEDLGGYSPESSQEDLKSSIASNEEEPASLDEPWKDKKKKRRKSRSSTEEERKSTEMRRKLTSSREILEENEDENKEIAEKKEGKEEEGDILKGKKKDNKVKKEMKSKKKKKVEEENQQQKKKDKKDKKSKKIVNKEEDEEKEKEMDAEIDKEIEKRKLTLGRREKRRSQIIIGEVRSEAAVVPEVALQASLTAAAVVPPLSSTIPLGLCIYPLLSPSFILLSYSALFLFLLPGPLFPSYHSCLPSLPSPLFSFFCIPYVSSFMCVSELVSG